MAGTQTKRCLNCGKKMVRPVWKGKADSTFAYRKFCSSKCYGEYMKKKNPSPSKEADRKRAQREIPNVPKGKWRHHIKGAGHGGPVEVIGHKEHYKKDKKAGRWGKGGAGKR